MNWTELLQLPATVLLIAAAVLLLVSIGHGVSCRRRLRDRRRMAASWRAMLALVFLALAALAAGGGLSLRGYRVLAAESPVARITAHHMGPQQWQLVLQRPDGSQRRIRMYGDDFRLEAIVLKWQLPAVLAGVPPVYRLDRLSGRYNDPQQARTAPHTVVDFNRAGDMDLFSLQMRYPHWLPMVDTIYGSGVYLPLVDGGRYQVHLMATGALVARPDPATALRLQRRGG
ncbi:hypothetical protein [Oleiagrimonas sp.]|uniref:hypothetical protein n=1 Tax=Oleiagrimonas sp. TaxID=2010330 RepID=UPI00260E50DF|nr:hypothetical protein [Oleiagrimonas sp.]MDA3915122.1 hypothetical protein [Oleiagrimonas sp.]